MFGRHDVVSSSFMSAALTDPDRALLGADLLRLILLAACIRSRRCASTVSRSLG